MIVHSPRTLRAKRPRRQLLGPDVPDQLVAADVVIPFHAGDAPYLPACVQAMAAQTHATPQMHVIADGCDFPTLSDVPNLYRYRHHEAPGQGPYRLANALVRGGYCQTDYIAIQDADDLSCTDRLWRQVQLLRQNNAGMVSSAMINFVSPEYEADEYLQQKRSWEPKIEPGRVFDGSVPKGRCVNSTRTTSLGLFRQLNGFADQKCGADFELDNRVRYFAPSAVIDDFEVMGLRRLHKSSITHGIMPLGTPSRDASLKALKASLAAVRKNPARAPEFGAMDTAFELEVV